MAAVEPYDAGEYSYHASQRKRPQKFVVSRIPHRVTEYCYETSENQQDNQKASQNFYSVLEFMVFFAR